MTITWIEQASLERRCAVLVCRRLMGRHTFESVAAEMHQVHSEFKIVDKVTMTTTDNASNFVKAFRVYYDSIPLPVEAVDQRQDLFGNDETESVDDDDEPVAMVVDNNSDEEIDDSDAVSFDLQPVDLGALLVAGDEARQDDVRMRVSDGEEEEVVDGNVRLPRHQRCAAHTLNLLGTTDVENLFGAAENHNKTKVPRERWLPSSSRDGYNEGLSTLRAFWAKYNRSSQVRVES